MASTDIDMKGTCDRCGMTDVEVKRTRYVFKPSG
jgi:hypothetical protein